MVSLGSRSTTMTPTLLGRWQIRFFLLATVGLVISLIVSQSVGNSVPLFALLYVPLFGLVWDVIYQFITSFRWDRDWPTCFQVAAGVVEGALVWGLILTKKLPGVAEPAPQVVRAGNPDRLLSPGDLTVLQPVQAYACACGFAFDRAAGKFCPQCGRPKVQQGVS